MIELQSRKVSGLCTYQPGNLGVETLGASIGSSSKQKNPDARSRLTHLYRGYVISKLDGFTSP